MTFAQALARRRDKASGKIWADEIVVDGLGGLGGSKAVLFLGSGQDASNLHQLVLHDVSTIINVADDVPNFHSTGITYCNLQVGDFGTDKGISRVFEQAFAFAETNHNKKILVHCANGSNRSATVVTAMIMKLYSISLKQSYAIVKKYHPASNPLPDNRKEIFNYATSHKDFETGYKCLDDWLAE
eukprot:m.263570 g.263570  ORF g.263570 m.263570 type:complete len:185 (-) comp51036_c0_seq1:294-848(-)